MIQFVSPLTLYQNNKEALDAAWYRVMNSGYFILGKEVNSFEQEFASYIGVKYGIGVATGTDAIELALKGFGIGVGDAVFTVSYTAVATVAAIMRTGATPVLLDVDETYCLDPEELNNVLGKFNERGLKPAAVIPVHLYGHPAKLKPILEIAKQHNLVVIEDCAQAHGAKYEGTRVGSFGDAAAFSFYPTKNLGGFGDGGMIVTNNAGVAERIQILRQYGWRERYISYEIGMNSRLDELQAALLRQRLSTLNQDNSKRKSCSIRYRQMLSDLPVILPPNEDSSDPVWHLFVIRVEGRDELQKYLQSKDIHTAIHYPQPVHQQPGYENNLPQYSKFINTEAYTGMILSLPMHPYLTEDEVDTVCQEIRNWIELS